MGEPENRRQREAMLATLAPVVDEEVVCGEWFTPAKGMEDDGLAAVKWLRRRLSSGDRLGPVEWLGAAIILAAIVAVDAVPRLRPTRPLPEG